MGERLERTGAGESLRTIVAMAPLPPLPRGLRRLSFLAAALALAGCGGGGGETPAETPATRAATAPQRPPRLIAPPCPGGAANCERASGPIIYVERTDPDGDGDAHFVLVSGEGITAPGISVIDVAASLRPDPLPGPGDFLAAAGPVYEGSHGQRQIQATAIRVARR
jgi:hypothetical protein